MSAVGAGTRVLLATAGSHGDVHPFIALGLALKRRGAEVVLSTNPYFEREIVAAGLGFHASSEHIDIRRFIQDNPWMHNPLVAASRLFGEVILPRVPDAQARTTELMREFRPHVAALHPLCLGGPAVLEQAGVPWLSVVLSPVVWMSRHDPCVTLPIGPGRGWGIHPPLWWWRMVRFGGRRVMRRLLHPALSADRHGRGLPPVRDHWEQCTRGGAASLGLWSGTFRAPMPDDPPGSRVCGFAWYDQAEQGWEGRERLEKFLNDGPAPIMFSLGTATVHEPRNFYEAAAEACRRLGRRGVLLIGREGTPPRNLPDGVACAGYAPFSWLMPRCCVSVHHGGIGSTGQGLRAGKPTVIVPFSHDQFDNAGRCERLGVSATVRASRLSVDALERALRRVMEDEDVSRRAAALSPAVGTDGAEDAADAVLRGRS